ncbi:hypothetical protein T492DRAFT_982044 [Pavlovales sp. CCMP2436]|nr:hypothetical protein T492DRAFT_982044 [Pavlovales sp. CCMP2436]
MITKYNEFTMNSITIIKITNNYKATVIARVSRGRAARAAAVAQLASERASAEAAMAARGAAVAWAAAAEAEDAVATAATEAEAAADLGAPSPLLASGTANDGPPPRPPPRAAHRPPPPPPALQAEASRSGEREEAPSRAPNSGVADTGPASAAVAAGAHAATVLATAVRGRQARAQAAKARADASRQAEAEALAATAIARMARGRAGRAPSASRTPKPSAQPCAAAAHRPPPPPPPTALVHTLPAAGALSQRLPNDAPPRYPDAARAARVPRAGGRAGATPELRLGLGLGPNLVLRTGTSPTSERAFAGTGASAQAEAAAAEAEAAAMEAEELEKLLSFGPAPAAAPEPTPVLLASTLCVSIHSLRLHAGRGVSEMRVTHLALSVEALHLSELRGLLLELTPPPSAAYEYGAASPTCPGAARASASASGVGKGIGISGGNGVAPRPLGLAAGGLAVAKAEADGAGKGGALRWQVGCSLRFPIRQPPPPGDMAAVGLGAPSDEALRLGAALGRALEESLHQSQQPLQPMPLTVSLAGLGAADAARAAAGGAERAAEDVGFAQLDLRPRLRELLLRGGLPREEAAWVPSDGGMRGSLASASAGKCADGLITLDVWPASARDNFDVVPERAALLPSALSGPEGAWDESGQEAPIGTVLLSLSLEQDGDADSMTHLRARTAAALAAAALERHNKQATIINTQAAGARGNPGQPQRRPPWSAHARARKAQALAGVV